MAHWDYTTGKISHFTPEKCNYPNWYRIDCGCSSGLQWGGEQPITCSRCGGEGFLFWHKLSGVYADYPGGPLRGKGQEEVENITTVI